ncbi:DUF4167 domain-containing protein [Candidatus Viadribacter manganicus]|uniref:DUF4167 domain-containing protein n=1 Tax=Candidatus Viadribacter manganicus TaxID=1759059 RepID=A0A1B1AMS4_9PROT|nr:DUF4167 domain-containing protein [Candidatus Viadribacter manganicus]ANP47878.1 hypothetical protein ATE48_19225 [Candidatus Viadribacter manganicus]
MKRQRGRGRKPGGGGGNYHNNQGGGGGHHHPNRTLESNGPETKVRGPASHIFERYLQLARDAMSSGDRVLSENYMQHADHYFRLVRSMQPAQPVHQPQQNFNEGGAEYEGDEDGAIEGEGGEETEARGDGDEQADADYQGDRQREGGGERSEGDRGPRRGRNRRRFNPDGERQGGHEARDSENRESRGESGEPREAREHREPREPRRERAEGEARPPRRERSEGGEPREPRRERQPREDRESGGREGFSDGPKPAFLRGGGGGSAE